MSRHAATHQRAHLGAGHSTGTVVVADPCAQPNARLVAAAVRAGGTGLLDVTEPADWPALRADLERRRATGWWLRPATGSTPDSFVGLEPTTVVLTLPADVTAWATAGHRVLVQVHSLAEARAAVEAGAAGLLASGREAGGRVGPTEAFMLLQQLADFGLPVWLRGSIGLHTAPAAIAGGATGVVVDVQTGLLRESQLGAEARKALAGMDGSQTRIVGEHRVYTRPDLPAAKATGTPDEIAAQLGSDLHDDLVPFGQDGALAAHLAEAYVTVGGLVQALDAAITEHQALAAEHLPLAPGAGIAATNGTRFPIAQGPMTRVSDRAEFALAVAEGGGLPFLALALLPADQVRDLLVETAELLGDRPWGVGVLGFAPAELLSAQLAVVKEVKPPFALVAGGRPGQAADLEAEGISTYLHVPSPGLLGRFHKEGARKFIFEGRECGGHVGPLSSHTLWEAQLAQLADIKDVSDVQVLLAGGIHDARSAQMASVALAPLAARGAATGVLMGTAYLFTRESVESGAITATYQDVAVNAEVTALVETAPGHATRCVETGFVRAFEARARELEEAGTPADQRWAELEQLNLGRLRVASKGLQRAENGLEQVSDEQQRAEGMYMIGEVATLRSEVTTVEDLHREVSEGGTELLRHDREPATTEDRAADPLDIAIVGISTLLPGSTDAEGFWADVLAGRDRVTEVPAERWNTDLYYDADAYDGKAGVKSPSKWGGFLGRIGFDPLAYGIPPAALASVEPVQLLALEVAARALDDAGYAQRAFDRERASVIFGAESGNDLSGAYGVRAFLPQLIGDFPAELDEWLPKLSEDSFPGVLANVIAGRIANRLDFGGVNYTVDAACASSLAALDAGAKELAAHTSDLVLVGGADLHNGLNDYLMFSSVHALSPSGRCRTFDADADGIALGEGITCVVLKRLADAERDGDQIYAVLDAVAGSSDGRYLGLTAPRKEGQQRAVVRALERSGHDAREIGLVEAHGTGTVVGDRTEMATLTELFTEFGATPGSAVLGSVKSQIGHTKCSAGLAGLVKVVKAVHHAVLPPTIQLKNPNPYYDAASSPFRFLDKPRPWADETRRAAVSAFGFGGTNFHAIVSSYDAGDRATFGAVELPVELFTFRGRTLADAQKAASALADKVAAIIEVDPDGQRHKLRDLAATVAGSGTGPIRISLVADSLDHLATQLSRVAGGTDAREGVFVAADGDLEAPQVGFLYPGQGSQRPGMAEDLFTTFGGLDDLLRLGERWSDVMFPRAAFTREERAAQQAAITATEVAQPTLGIASMAITRLLRRAGVEPAVAGGHSYGELAALAAAGAFDEATLLELSAARGESILTAIDSSGGDPGTMAAVALPIDEVRALAAEFPTLVVANHNGPKQVVLSGPTNDVRAAVAAWEARGIKATLIPVACAFHSPLIATAGERLAERLADLDLRAPQFPVWSNTTAEPYPADDDSAVGRLLVEQVTAGVRFVEQVEAMYAAGIRVFVEAGPGRVLTQQVARILGDRPHHVVACDAKGESGLRRFLMALGELATLGVPVDPAMLFDGRGERLDLNALPVATPGWTVDGAFVRGRDGKPLPRSLQPSDALPVLNLTDLHSPTGAHMTQQPYGTDPGAVVHEYLRSIRQLVAAERDVMLRYLGTEVPATSAYDIDAAPVVAPALGQPHYTQPQYAQPQQAQPVQAAAVQAAPVPAAEPAAPAAPQLTAEDLMAAVQAVVAERTGYPVDMLEPDLDLEADLSIDSIKRLEIVGELVDNLGLGDLAGASGDSGMADDSVAEELSRHKTLRALVDWLEPRIVDAQAGAAAQQAPTAAAATSRAFSSEELMAAVQAVVAERTGYPVDMLEPDLDLEADLSIDSIKRLEIVGELVDNLGLGDLAGASGDSGMADDSVAEELSRHKTLRALVGWLEPRLNPDLAAEPDASSGGATEAPAPAEPAEPEIEIEPSSLREVVVQPLGPTVPIGDLSGSKATVVAGEPRLTEAVVEALSERGAEVSTVSVGEATDSTAVSGADVLVDLCATLEGSDARTVFSHVRPALLGGATRVLATSVPVLSDGAPTGVPGLFRSLARERTDALLRSVEVAADDLAETADVTSLAVALVDELLDLDAPTSVSWANGTRTTRVAGPARPITAPGRVPLTKDSVVVLTGGARGITARAAEAIAEQVACRFVLVGRSALPGDEDPRFAAATTAADLRREILAIGELRKPAEIEAATSKILAEREIRATLARLRDMGAEVDYYAVDVRSPELGRVLDEVRERHGRIDAVVHGAGVLDDKLMVDKGTEGFDRVFGTKVDGARTILERLPSGVGTVVLFGSVSGVFGNKGQSDYSAANDALDTLARTHDGTHGARVVSLDWGPWAGGGMVSADLERDYARRGIGLVDPADGTAALLTALTGTEAASQLVVMRGAPEAFAPPVRNGVADTARPEL